MKRHQTTTFQRFAFLFAIPLCFTSLLQGKNIVGTDGDDIIGGTTKNDFIQGRDGDDRIIPTSIGVGEKDRVEGGAGSDIYQLEYSGEVLYVGALAEDYLEVLDWEEGEKVRLAGSRDDYIVAPSFEGDDDYDAIYYDINGNGTFQIDIDDLICVIYEGQDGSNNFNILTDAIYVDPGAAEDSSELVGVGCPDVSGKAPGTKRRGVGRFSRGGGNQTIRLRRSGGNLIVFLKNSSVLRSKFRGRVSGSLLKSSATVSVFDATNRKNANAALLRRSYLSNELAPEEQQRFRIRVRFGAASVRRNYLMKVSFFRARTTDTIRYRGAF